MGFFVRIYMRVCKKMVIYLGIKTPQSRKERKYTWQKNARISCSRNDCKYTWEKTARTSCHNFETNGRPYLCTSTFFAAMFACLISPRELPLTARKTVFSHLKWNDHVDNITAKASQRIYLLKQFI